MSAVPALHIPKGYVTLTIHSLMKRSAAAALLSVSLVLQATTSVLAGTTGSVSGTVVDTNGHPEAGVVVTASSASQVVSQRTTATGSYNFLSLNPDTYTISVPAYQGHDAFAQAGVTVQADAALTVSLTPAATLRTIGTTAVHGTSALVKPGTTNDVYSINAVGADKASSIGGGGNLNSAWSAIATVPGVYVSPGQSGYIGAGPSLSIRGGDYDQVGYEFDGVPVNRSFDNYPSGTLSSLGNQEIQVYTGANPANSEAQGLSGYINQVIRSGTYPGYTNITGAIGSPIFYNKASFEFGGANPSRTFSYYVGLGGYDQDYRYFDQFNGSGLQQNYGSVLAPCSLATIAVASCTSPGGVNYNNPDPVTGNPTTEAMVLGPSNADGTSENKVRDTVANVHFGIPKKDGSKDDVQLLLDIDNLRSYVYTSVNDLGGTNFVDNTVENFAGVPPTYIDGLQYNAPIGGVVNPNTVAGQISNYYFPGSPTGRPSLVSALNGLTNLALLPNDLRGEESNDQNIFKAQFQHNFGSNAFLRVYGYTYYSDWLMNDQTAAYSEYVAETFGVNSPDYELSSHTRGVSAEFSDQIGQHLLSLQANYSTANSTRDNNTEWLNGLYGPDSVNARTAIGAVVNAADPTYGCFSQAGTLANCNSYGTANTATGPQYLTLGEAAGGGLGVQALPGACAVPGVASTTCEYLAVGNGEYATYNTVTPKFLAGSITDNWKPTDKLTINLGLREDQFQFVTATNNENAARSLYYNSFNQFECFAPNSPTVYNRTAAGACPVTAGGVQTTAANVVDQNGGTDTYDVLQPRIGLTFTLNPSTVIRASYGRNAEAPNTAYEQYDALQANQPNLLYNSYGFQQYGFTSSLHSVAPEVSNNYDFSLEKSFAGDMSIKLTPFYRKTQGQIQSFYLSFATSFVSGLNVGNQTSDGFEFELDKGDFSRNGLAARLSFGYTNSYINYTGLPNGAGTVLDPLNSLIKNYNSYTSYCAANPTNSSCAGGSTATGTAAAQCYANSGDGTPVAAIGGACPGGSIANPYWNAAPQALLNASSNLATYDVLPGPPGSGNGNAYGAPYVSTLIVQYKHNRLALTPAIQFVGGQKYGTPGTTYGVSPDTCTGTINAASSRYDIGTCGGGSYFGDAPGYEVMVPDQQTGLFDGLGAFVEPNLITANLQASYDVSKHLTIVGTFANLYHNCFGGSKVPWAVTGACGYEPNNYLPVGNNFNPGATIQPLLQNTYIPYFNATPFNMYIEARLKI